MESLGDALRKIIQTRRVSEEPVAKCPHCGRDLYRVQLFTYRNGEWQPLGAPFVEQCDCEGAQREREEKERERIRQAVAEMRRAKIQALLKRSGLGRRFYQRTFENWEKKDGMAEHAYQVAWDYAVHWWDNYKAGRGLYIYGPYGTGKTHLAAAIVNYVIQTYEVPVIFGTLTTLFNRLKDAMVAGDTYRLDRERQQLYDVELLVLDDLGKERPTDWVAEELFNLINYRYENMKPVIITSNFALPEFARKYDKWSRETGERDLGSAMMSRLKEMVEIVPLFGVDIRTRKEGGE